MDELKACPFCGNEPQEITTNGKPLVVCWCRGCVNDPKNWNTRPIEDALNKRIAELKELLDTESQLSNQFYLLLVDNPKSKKLADDLIEALRINGKEVQE